MDKKPLAHHLTVVIVATLLTIAICAPLVPSERTVQKCADSLASCKNAQFIGKNGECSCFSCENPDKDHLISICTSDPKNKLVLFEAEAAKRQVHLDLSRFLPDRRESLKNALELWPKGEEVAATSSTEQAVRQLFDDLVSSYAKNDAAVPARILADDFTFTNPFGEVMTKAQRLAEIKPGGFQFDSYTVDDVNVRVYGNTALVTNRTSLTGKRGDKDLSGQYRVTSVFVKRGGRWQVVAAQTTRIAQSPTQ